MSWCVVCIWFSAGQTRSNRAPSWAQQGHESLWKPQNVSWIHESTCLQSQPVNEAAHPSPARVIFPEIIRNRLLHSHIARCWHLLHFSRETATNKTIPIKLNWLRMGFHKRTELIQQLAAARQGWSLLPPSLAAVSPFPLCSSELTETAQHCSSFFSLLSFPTGSRTRPGYGWWGPPEPAQGKKEHKGRRNHCHPARSPPSWFLAPLLSPHQQVLITADRFRNCWQGQDRADHLWTETVLASDGMKQ